MGRKAQNNPKFKSSAERKIEKIWTDAKRLEWNYADFIVFTLEVIIALRYRNGVNEEKYRIREDQNSE